MSRHLAKTVLVLAVALALVACGPKDNLVDCHARRQALAKFSDDLLAEPSTGLHREHDLLLLELERDLPDPGLGDYVGDFFSVSATVRGLYVEGDPVDAANIVERLAESRRLIEKVGASRGDPPLHQAALMIAPDARWGDVVTASHALRENGFDQQVFVFRRKVRVAQPGPSKVDGELAEIRDLDAMRGMKVALATGITQRLASVCSAAELDAAPKELQPGDCRCKLDDASAMAVMWFIHPPDRFTAAARTIVASATPAPAAPAVPVEIALPADTTWAVAHRAIVDAPVGTMLVLRAR